MDKRVLEWWLIDSPLAVKTNISKGADFSKWDAGAMLKMKCVFSLFFFGFDAADAVHRPVLDVHVNVLTSEGAAEPRLCADVILFLASDLSRGVNGAIIPVDQGWSVI